MEAAPVQGLGMQMNVSGKIFLNGIYFDEIEAPKL
jgi:hypothetical protein